jgi:serine/threonine-protein kinase
MSGERERGAERVGRTIREKYTLDRVLGVGGMAVVYAATHRNRKRFAVKMLHPELSQHKDVSSRFLREGYVANTVDHPGAVAVVDDDIADDGSAFLVMELLDGDELEAVWERAGRRLPIDVVLACAEQLLDVLVAAHSKGIVHRDLKPANLFITKVGQLKVLDFGIARLREAGAESQTQTGSMMGTPAFLPPEQAAGRTREIDGQTDLWAVGATMFTLLTGQYVHPADNGAQMVIMAATQQARSLGTLMPGAFPWLVAWVDRALTLARSDRWPDATTMLAELRRQVGTVFAARSSQSILADYLSAARPSAPAAAQSPFAATVLPAPSAPPARVSAAIAPTSADARSYAGGTTAQPLSVSSAPAPTPAAGGRPLWIPIVLATLGAAGLVSGAIVFVGHEARTQARDPNSTTSAETPPRVVTLAVASAALSATPIPSATATAGATPTPSAAATTARPLAKTTSVGASGVLSPSATSPGRPPNCDPPYTVDVQGKKHFKSECF